MARAPRTASPGPCWRVSAARASCAQGATPADPEFPNVPPAPSASSESMRAQGSGLRLPLTRRLSKDTDSLVAPGFKT